MELYRVLWPWLTSKRVKNQNLFLSKNRERASVWLGRQLYSLASYIPTRLKTQKKREHTETDKQTNKKRRVKHILPRVGGNDDSGVGSNLQVEGTPAEKILMCLLTFLLCPPHEGAHRLFVTDWETIEVVKSGEGQWK